MATRVEEHVAEFEVVRHPGQSQASGDMCKREGKPGFLVKQRLEARVHSEKQDTTRSTVIHDKITS